MYMYTMCMYVIHVLVRISTTCTYSTVRLIVCLVSLLYYRYGLHLLQCTESCEDSGELVGGVWAGTQAVHLRGEEEGDPTGVL